MIATDMGNFGRGDYEALIEAAQSQVKPDTNGTFRLNPDWSYELRPLNGYQYGVVINLLNRTPEIDRYDQQLYPYSRLSVMWHGKHANFRETSGALIRGRNGVLHEWYEGKDPVAELKTGIDVFTKEKTPESVVPTNLYPYFDPLDWIGDNVREDRYGRNQEEVDWEKLNGEQFLQEADILLLPSLDRAAVNQRLRERNFGYRHTRFPLSRRLHAKHTLSGNRGVVRVDEEKKGRLGFGIETVVCVFPAKIMPALYEFKLRDADGRLGVTRYDSERARYAGQGYVNNPLDMWEGMALNAMLKSLHNQ